MTLAALKASLALWLRRHRYRQRKLDVAHQRNDHDAIAKWGRLLEEAGIMVRRRRKEIAAKTKSTLRGRIVAAAEQAAANYRRNPYAYHYLAGGVANTIILRPTPHNYRSDCSQFVDGAYALAGAPVPGGGQHGYVNTNSMMNSGRRTWHPKPGDLGLYGRPPTAGRAGWTHHVELYVGGGRFIGHGTPQIDGKTPGQPDFYWTYEWLD